MSNPEEFTLDEARDLAREVLTVFPRRENIQARATQTTNGGPA